jgi:ABC-type transporter Mla subunit MlaD
MRFTSEIRVGIVVVLGLCLIFFGYFYLRGVGLGADLYYVRLQGAVAIAQGNDVRLQGVKVGQVKDVNFDALTQKPILVLAIRHGHPPIKFLRSYAYTVQSAGIIGESYVDIRGTYKPDSLEYRPNDPTQVIMVKAGGGLNSVTQSAQSLVEDFRKTLSKVDVTLDRVNNGMLGNRNQVAIARALEGVARLTNNAAQSFGPNGVRIGFGDPRAQANLSETLANAAQASRLAKNSAANVEAASQNARLLTHDLRLQTNALLGQNRGKITQLLASMNQAAVNVAGVTETLDFVLKQGGFKENAQLTFQALRRTAENMEVATAGLRKLSDDKATQDDIHTTIHSMRLTSEALRDTTTAIKEMVADPQTGAQIKGALGTLGDTAKNLQAVSAGLKSIVGDPAMQENLKAAAANLNATLAATRSSAERVNALLGGKHHSAPSGSAQEKATAGVRVNTLPSGVDFTYRRFLDPRGRAATGSDNAGRNYGDLTFNAEFLGKPLRLGVAGIGDGSKLTAQTGVYLGPDGAVRYGLYRGKLGAGVELRRGALSLEGNIYDPNHESYNVYAGLQLNPHLEVLAGQEYIRGRRSPSVAVRVRP